MDVVVSTKDLCKRFGKKLAVDHVNMTLHQGDIYGLIGRNGAGKTTIMRMLCGLAAPTEGSISLFGSSDLEKQRRRMGCTIESPALYPTMTARENMDVYRIFRRIKDKSVCERLLDTVGLRDAGNKKTKDFSLGMKQRLMIAIALLGDPELLVLDEPINGLDPAGIMDVRDLILRLNHERHLTIIVSSHILDELSRFATCYGVIHNGKLITEFTAAELQDRCRKKLKIGVSDPERALAFISEHITNSVCMEGDGYITLLDSPDRAGEVNRMLVENGFEVTALFAEGQRLEDYFMELIGGNVK